MVGALFGCCFICCFISNPAQPHPSEQSIPKEFQFKSPSEQSSSVLLEKLGVGSRREAGEQALTVGWLV